MQQIRPIYVNARFVTQEVTGVQRFAQEISLELKRLLPEVKFLCPSNIKQQALAQALDVEVIGRRTGHAWEQLDLPKTLRERGSPLLVNLMSTAPVLYSNQIATLHDINFVRFPQSYSRSFIFFYRLIVPLILKRVRVLLTVSEFSKREISEYYGFAKDRILVIANAVNGALKAEATDPNVPKDAVQPYVLAVSSTNYHKNFNRLIDAFNRLGPVGDGVALKVVGKSNGSFRTQDMSQEADSAIQFLGRVDDEELASLYGGALAFAFPSLYEGFGIPPLEAQMNNCPVVASRAASMPEVLADSALYFDPTDVADIRSALADIISNPALRHTLIDKGQANVRRFSWTTSANLVADAARKLNS